MAMKNGILSQLDGVGHPLYSKTSVWVASFWSGLLFLQLYHHWLMYQLFASSALTFFPPGIWRKNILHCRSKDCCTAIGRPKLLAPSAVPVTRQKPLIVSKTLINRIDIMNISFEINLSSRGVYSNEVYFGCTKVKPARSFKFRGYTMNEWFL